MMRSLFSIFLCMGVQLTAAEFDPSLQGVRFFAYQLQNFDTPDGLQVLRDSHYDLLVIEQTRSIKGSEDYDSAADVASLHATLGSSVNPKKLVCYLDAGQAEDFRWYWQDGWGVGNPAWILAPDPDWPGDYPVKFWDPAWKALMKQDLAMIVADGYDGAYLDWMEIYAFEPLVQAAQAEGKDPREELIAFIRELRDYARSLKPDFFFIAQNAAELGACREWLDLFSGIGQEDVWFTWGDGQPGDVPQDPELTAEFLSNLALWKAAGKVVFDIEYAQEPANVAAAYANGKAEGFITHVTTKELDQLSNTPPPDCKIYRLTSPINAEYPVFSPDLQWVAFKVEDFGLCKIRIDGTDFTLLVDVPGWYKISSGISWNAVHDRIFFSAPLDDTHISQIWSIRSDGSDLEQVTNCANGCREPSLSPDGEWMAYIDGGGFLAKRDLITDEEIILIDRANWAKAPDWSPAGDLIAFHASESGATGIWVMSPEGSNLHNLVSTSCGLGLSDPSFSPDGRWIVYEGNHDLVYWTDIYIISVDSPSLRYRLTYTTTPQPTSPIYTKTSPSISPDGRTLAYGAYDFHIPSAIWTMPIYLPPPSPHERPVARP